MKLAELAQKINQNPEDPENLRKFGNLLVLRNEHSSALLVFKFLYKVEKNVTNLILLCKSLVRSGVGENINTAISLINFELNNLKNSQKDLFELRKIIGNAYTNIGNFDLAKMYYESCLRMNKEHDVVYTNLGVLYLTNKMYQEARESFEKAIQFKIDNTNALIGLGMTLMDMGHLGLSMIRLNQALDYEPTNMDAINALITLAYKSGNLNMVVQRLKDYLQHDPLNVDMLYSYAAIEYQLGDFEQSRLELEKALLIDPEHHYSNELKDMILSVPVFTGIANKEVDSTI